MVSDQMDLYFSNQRKDLVVVSLILTCDHSLKVMLHETILNDDS